VVPALIAAVAAVVAVAVGRFYQQPGDGLTFGVLQAHGADRADRPDTGSSARGLISAAIWSLTWPGAGPWRDVAAASR